MRSFSLKQKAASFTALAMLAPMAAMADAPDYVGQVTTELTTNLGYAVGVVVAAGLALVSVAFVSFILRKGRAAANGRI